MIDIILSLILKKLCGVVQINFFLFFDKSGDIVNNICFFQYYIIMGEDIVEFEV